jgi:ribonuclease III
VIQELACNDKLKVIAWLNGLDRFLVQIPSHKGRPSRNFLASATEALVGAVWLDSGRDIQAVQSVIETLGILGLEPDGGEFE